MSKTSPAPPPRARARAGAAGGEGNGEGRARARVREVLRGRPARTPAASVRPHALPPSLPPITPGPPGAPGPRRRTRRRRRRRCPPPRAASSTLGRGPAGTGPEPRKKKIINPARRAARGYPTRLSPPGTGGGFNVSRPA